VTFNQTLAWFDRRFKNHRISTKNSLGLNIYQPNSLLQCT